VRTWRRHRACLGHVVPAAAGPAPRFQKSYEAPSVREVRLSIDPEPTSPACDRNGSQFGSSMRVLRWRCIGAPHRPVCPCAKP